MRLLVRALSAAILAVSGTQVQASWYQAKSAHFVIYANENPNDLKLYAQNLERFDSAARQLMRLSDPDLTDAGLVNIFVLPNLGAVSKLAGSNEVAGLYIARSDGSYAFVPSARDMSSDYANVIFFHEYTHHLQLQTAEYPVPAWVAEGFADYMSTAEVNSDGSVTFGKQAPGREWDPRQQVLLPLSQMVGGTYGGLNSQKFENFYSRGWLLTNYLLGEPKRANQLNNYLGLIAKGAKPIDAATTAFGDLGRLQNDLDRYANSNSLYGFKVGADLIRIRPVTIRPLTAGEAAALDVRIHSKRGVDPKTAPVVAAEAEKVALQYPQDSFAQSCLAEAEYDAHDYPKAAAAADRAIALNPTDIHALLYKGMVGMALAKAHPETANWDAIRSAFIKANQIDTESAEPLRLYYESYGAAHQPAPPNAVDGLIYAMALAPRDQGLRMEAVQELLAQGKAADAKTAFAMIAYTPHLPAPMREWADKVMQQINAGDTKAALASVRSFKPAEAAQKKGEPGEAAQKNG